MAFDVLGESERRLIQQEMFQLEDQKLALEEQYQYLFENALAGLFRIDSSANKVLTANKELLRTFGVEQLEELDYLFNRYAIFEELAELKSEVMPRGDSLTFSSPLVVNEEERMVQFSARLPQDTFIIEGAAKDITDIVQAEKRMLEAIREAEQANHAKSLFLANMSHEIRTPLNGIVGFAEIIAELVEEPSAGYAGKILDESSRLMTLINQLLDISKIEANQISLETESFPIRDILREQVDLFMPKLTAKGLTVKIDVDDRLAEIYLGDSFRIGQVFTNLLSNALKFTSRGTIGVSAELVEVVSGFDVVGFSVSDTGIGIREEMQQYVFEKFIQADNSIERRFGGTGLGVAICKELVELMKGSITLDSRVGEGTTFTFVIPLKQGKRRLDRVHHVAPNEFDINKIPPSRILLVEDYPNNRDILKLQLEALPLELVTAGNGEEAIARFSMDSFDLILMDIHMPLMSGLEASRRIRELPGGETIPIIGMSASAFNSDKDKCRGVGMNDFLAKPIRRDTLYSHLCYWLCEGNKTGFAELESHGISPAPKDGDILRFDDFCREMGSREDGEMIIEGFIESSRNLLGAIPEALDRGDFITAHRNSHSLKGGALNIMADELSRDALELETALKEPGPRDIMPLYDKVSRSFERVAEEFEGIRGKN